MLKIDTIYRTRGGGYAKVISKSEDPLYPFFAVILTKKCEFDPNTVPFTVSEHGLRYTSGTQPDDLISEAIFPRVVYANVKLERSHADFCFEGDHEGPDFFLSREEADKAASAARVGCIRIELSDRFDD